VPFDSETSIRRIVKALFLPDGKLKPDDALSHYNLGTTLGHRGKLQEAVAECHKARDNAQRGSPLSPLIERALTATDH
jgi:hypothetical protein